MDDFFIESEEHDDDCKVLQFYETRRLRKCVVYTIEEYTVDEPKENLDSISTTSTSEEDDDGVLEAPSSVFTVQEFYNKFIVRTYEECIEEYNCAQRSLKWHNARKHSITASNFGAAAGNNSYQSPKELVIDKLWNTFKGNAFTMYGSFHEQDAFRSLQKALEGPLQSTVSSIYASVYKNYENDDLKCIIHETGLLKSYTEPWIAVSPDGLLEIQGHCGSMMVLIEYKCPARSRHSQTHPYSRYKHNMPEYYVDQVQGIMGLFDKCKDLISMTVPSCISGPQICLFVVWQPIQIHVTLVPYDQQYFTQSLYPKLKQWFFEQYLPFAVLKENDLLLPKSLDVIQEIVL